METERKRSHQRARRKSGNSPQSEQPLDPMSLALQTLEASARTPDTRTTIARSMSRYKRARPKPSRSISTPSIPAVPPVEPSAGSLAATKERPTTTFDRFRHPLDAEEDDDDAPVASPRKNSHLQPPRHSPQYGASNPKAARNPRPEHDIQGFSYREANYYDLSDTVPVRAHKDSLQRRYSDGSRTHRKASRHAKADQEITRLDASSTEPRVRLNVLPIRPAMVQKKSFSQKIAGLVSQPQSAAEAKEQLKSMISKPIAIEPENVLSLPQFDAPKSAVNAGERTVKVKYKEFRVPVTVVPTTTSLDVIRAVSDKVATPIHHDSSVMLESFKQLGLERPLRKYEHIRDVLNSWDDDSQNVLIIEPSSTEGHDDDLDLKHVPKNQPDDASFYMYHSQRPGHWDKRVVMVRSDGQMLVAKSEGGEFSNICHLSDFDIYIPTAREMAKKIRPPKRICFAVKSQQKSNMFVSTLNFVHFFASNDKRIAKSLYTTVQEWRSWYLVKMMGRGVQQPSQPIGSCQGQIMTSMNVGGKPVVPAQSSQGTNEAQRVHSAPSKPSIEASRRPVMHNTQHPAPQDVHPAYRNNINKERNDRQAPTSTLVMKQSSTGTVTEDPFTGGGLLGRSYTQRKKAQQDHEPIHSDTPIVHIPTFSPSPVKADLTGLKRTSSQRQKPKPLIDLTPVYQEPPQHSRKGKGVTPGHIPAGGLVDIATSPEVAIPIPPKNDWRRPGTSSVAEVSPPRGHQQ
ncbi:MAG: hypothetical protein Q9209_004635 [Squamulea sp. 1 TL-2023]